MTTRKGLGKGMGRGYRNILIMKDPKVHSDSAKGMKQPQKVKLYQYSPAIRQDIKNEQNWQSFLKGKGQQYMSNFVYRYKGTFIKDRGYYADAKMEVDAHNLLANEFDFYPRALLKKKGNQWYVVVSEVNGFHAQVINQLSTNQKFQLAKATRLLYEHGYIDMDISPKNVVIDKDKNAVFVDLGALMRLKPESLEQQYNINIIRIFGISDHRHKRFRTMSLKELGIA